MYNTSMTKRAGYLEVIAGPMYCGKTEELIRQVKRASIGKKHVQVYKHAIDTRYGKDKKVFSHAGLSFKSYLITEASEILKKLNKNTEIVAIDEAQWFGQDLIPVISELVEKGIRVIVAGLAMTYDRQPFAPMPTLMALADKTTKLSAICTICGNDAVFHKRIVKASTMRMKPVVVNAFSKIHNFYLHRLLNVFLTKSCPYRRQTRF
jgi:thymidine kinase